MLCNINGCKQATGNFADMDRHILTHFRSPIPCPGCPKTFSREDALRRHRLKESQAHCSPARSKFLPIFNARPDVIAIRADAAQKFHDGTKSDSTRMIGELAQLFEEAFIAHSRA
ncbi:hypothetical protein DFH09DRAFT_1130945 [Mycena vulgaris]|nr:hypothetical protein DFH09DRAFT_1130945 [Mycena vulgaris]